MNSPVCMLPLKQVMEYDMDMKWIRNVYVMDMKWIRSGLISKTFPICWIPVTIFAFTGQEESLEFVIGSAAYLLRVGTLQADIRFIWILQFKFSSHKICWLHLYLGRQTWLHPLLTGESFAWHEAWGICWRQFPCLWIH